MRGCAVNKLSGWHFFATPGHGWTGGDTIVMRMTPRFLQRVVARDSF
jgi:hypothetical protein